MTQQRVVELWKEIEGIIDTLTDPLKELFEKRYHGKCEKEYIEIVGKLVDMKYEYDGRKDL